ncbi:VanZ family protein [Myroides sp. LJL119]
MVYFQTSNTKRSLGRNIILGIALLWTILVIILCLVEAENLNSESIFDVPYKDKIAHFVFYFTFSFLWLMYLLKSQLKASKSILTFLIFMVAVLLGGSIEFAQYYFTSSRSAEWADFFANCLGSFFGILLCLTITKKNNKKSPC